MRASIHLEKFEACILADRLRRPSSMPMSSCNVCGKALDSMVVKTVCDGACCFRTGVHGECFAYREKTGIRMLVSNRGALVETLSGCLQPKVWKRFKAELWQPEQLATQRAVCNCVCGGTWAPTERVRMGMGESENVPPESNMENRAFERLELERLKLEEERARRREARAKLELGKATAQEEKREKDLAKVAARAARAARLSKRPGAAAAAAARAASASPHRPSAAVEPSSPTEIASPTGPMSPSYRFLERALAPRVEQVPLVKLPSANVRVGVSDTAVLKRLPVSRRLVSPVVLTAPTTPPPVSLITAATPMRVTPSVVAPRPRPCPPPLVITLSPFEELSLLTVPALLHAIREEAFECGCACEFVGAAEGEQGTQREQKHGTQGTQGKQEHGKRVPCLELRPCHRSMALETLLKCAPCDDEEEDNEKGKEQDDEEEGQEDGKENEVRFSWDALKRLEEAEGSILWLLRHEHCGSHRAWRAHLHCRQVLLHEFQLRPSSVELAPEIRPALASLSQGQVLSELERAMDEHGETVFAPGLSPAHVRVLLHEPRACCCSPDSTSATGICASRICTIHVLVGQSASADFIAECVAANVRARLFEDRPYTAQRRRVSDSFAVAGMAAIVPARLGSSTTTAPPPLLPPPQLPSELTDDHVRLCSICLEMPMSRIFVPCGHVSACGACADAWLATERTCPLCHDEATDALEALHASTC